MKENTKISVLSLFIYLLDYCFFCIFPAFFAVWAFFTFPLTAEICFLNLLTGKKFRARAGKHYLAAFENISIVR